MKLGGIGLCAFLAVMIGCGESGTRDDESTVSPEPDTESVTEMTSPVMYYRFADAELETLPEGSVTILPDELVLVPAEADPDGPNDPGARIAEALHAVMEDTLNPWTGEELVLGGVTIFDDHAVVEFRGRITAPGDIVLVAARQQILLTIFSEPCVQTAVITLDGECVGNLGISHESEERPPDYEFSRADLDIR